MKFSVDSCHHLLSTHLGIWAEGTCRSVWIISLKSRMVESVLIHLGIWNSKFDFYLKWIWAFWSLEPSSPVGSVSRCCTVTWWPLEENKFVGELTCCSIGGWNEDRIKHEMNTYWRAWGTWRTRRTLRRAIHVNEVVWDEKSKDIRWSDVKHLLICHHLQVDLLDQ